MNILDNIDQSIASCYHLGMIQWVICIYFFRVIRIWFINFFGLHPMFIPTKGHIRRVLLDEFHQNVNGCTSMKSIQNNLWWYLDLKKSQVVVFSFSKWEFQSKGSAPLVNRKGVILHHDHTRPYIAQNIKDIFEELDREKSLHLPYSPDLVPSL